MFSETRLGFEAGGHGVHVKIKIKLHCGAGAKQSACLPNPSPSPPKKKIKSNDGRQSAIALSIGMQQGTLHVQTCLLQAV